MDIKGGWGGKFGGGGRGGVEGKGGRREKIVQSWEWSGREGAGA